MVSERGGPRKWADRLNDAQRVVLSIGAGLALVVVGRAAGMGGSHPDGGWFGYAPLTSLPEQPFLDRHPGLRLLMWLVLIAAWIALSLWLFRGPDGTGTPSSDRPGESGPGR